MSKVFTTALLAALVAVLVYAARRRIVFALKTGAIAYVVLIFARLLLSFLTGGAQGEHVEEFFWPVVIILVGWVILSRFSTQYAERRQKQKDVRRASGAGRPAR
jgi:positive regulator of sigma E activity